MWVFVAIKCFSQACDLLFCFLSRLTKDTVRFKDELDIMKFICKDFWTCVFKKQIDNLRTNHQVTLVSLPLTFIHTGVS